MRASLIAGRLNLEALIKQLNSKVKLTIRFKDNNKRNYLSTKKTKIFETKPNWFIVFSQYVKVNHRNLLLSQSEFTILVTVYYANLYFKQKMMI